MSIHSAVIPDSAAEAEAVLEENLRTILGCLLAVAAAAVLQVVGVEIIETIEEGLEGEEEEEEV